MKFYGGFILSILIFIINCLGELKNPYPDLFFLYYNYFNTYNNFQNTNSAKNNQLKGIIDTSFGINGTTIIDFGGVDYARGFLIHNNKIIIVGDNSSDFAIVKLLSNGDFDTSFGTSGSGKITHDLVIGITSYNDYAIDITKAIDGNYIISGTNSNSTRNVLVVKINASTGNLDTSFGPGGGS
ncbi:MAG: hypothetical protein KatS3mg129_1591 [Leptospiraceae bacterium]|nr:MAG: hypothetical protein KatS3mg129_1591 [Leptospiraceae bacterium]